MRFLVLFFLICPLALSGCMHHYTPKVKKSEAQPFNPEWVISTPLRLALLKTSQKSSELITFEKALITSGYFSALSADANLTLKLQLTREMTFKTSETMDKITAVASVGVLPAGLTHRYVLNGALYKHETLISGYYSEIDAKDYVVLWNMVKPREEALIINMLPRIMPQLTTDIANLKHLKD